MASVVTAAMSLICGLKNKALLLKLQNKHSL
jgi:hypothetical protein